MSEKLSIAIALVQFVCMLCVAMSAMFGKMNQGDLDKLVCRSISG